MYKAMFETDLTRPFDSLTMLQGRPGTKTELHGVGRLNQEKVMYEEIERSRPEPEPEYIYTVLTEAPQDWSTSYVTYYQKKAGSEDEYELIPAGTGAPVFEQNKYYSRSEA